jgi:hapalindole-type alkaloid chlorinase
MQFASLLEKTMTVTSSNSQKSDFFRLLDIHVSEVENYSGSLQDIFFNRSFEGLIVREVFSKDIIEQVVERLNNDEGEISSVFVSSQSKLINVAKVSHSYGPGVFGSKPDLKEYFAKASIFRRACSTLFEGKLGYEKRIESIFYPLAGGIPVKIPTGPEGQSYSSSSIRVAPDGHEFPVHVGKELLLLPQANHIRSLVDSTDQISFFIPLSLPEAGGELVVFDAEFEERKGEKNPNITLDKLVVNTQGFNADQYASKVLSPGLGDMLLFDGGRYYHRVTPIIGSCPRRTIGGFLNFSRNHDILYYWN